MKIYVASSWRNKYQPEAVQRLRVAGHDVYDFRNPAPDNKGFSWRQVAPEWQSGETRLSQYMEMLAHPVAEQGFNYDYEAMRNSDACVLVMPAGRSANIEAGYFVGAGKKLLVYLPEPIEPELMYKMADGICMTLDEVIQNLLNP